MQAELKKLPPHAVARLAAFKREVERALPGRVARVTLFGSRARGDAQEDTDYDVAVFVRDDANRLDIREAVSEAAFSQLAEDVFISPIVLPEDYLDSPRGRTALRRTSTKTASSCRERTGGFRVGKRRRTFGGKDALTMAEAFMEFCASEFGFPRERKLPA